MIIILQNVCDYNVSHSAEAGAGQAAQAGGKAAQAGQGESTHHSHQLTLGLPNVG